MSSSTMAANAAGVAAIVVVEVAVFAAAKAVDAIITAVVISVIIRAVIVIAYDSSPFTASFQKHLSVIKASFAAIASCYFEIALVL